MQYNENGRSIGKGGVQSPKRKKHLISISGEQLLASAEATAAAVRYQGFKFYKLNFSQ